MRGKLPGPLRAARVLLFVHAGVALMILVGLFLAYDIDARTLGRLTPTLIVPGVLAFIFGLRLPKGGRPLFWAIIVLQVWLILGALATLGHGDPRGLTQLLIPIAMLVLVLRRSSRGYLRSPTESDVAAVFGDDSPATATSSAREPELDGDPAAPAGSASGAADADPRPRAG